ncbi:MAG: GntR family transcriptional regulator [Capsulimonadaceae bacterium]|nr:GntR family transcriptional regulator [Capsulimonadaceae bacterium]
MTKTGSSKKGVVGMEPTYKRIEGDLRNRIASGLLRPGEMLPSRSKLARQYGVALATAERAVNILLAEGTLEASGGRGTFVSRGAAFDGQPVASGDGNHLASAGISLRETTAYNRERFNSKPALGIIAELPASSNDPSDNYYFENRVALQAIERYYAERGFPTRFMSISRPDGSHLLIDKVIEALAEAHVDGIVVAFCNDADKVRRAYTAARRLDLPLVYVSSGELEMPLPHVYYDNRDAGFQATQHLLDQGCREIVMISPYVELWAERRAMGVQDALSAADVPARSCRFFPDGPQIAPWNLPGWDQGRDVYKQLTQAAGYRCARALFESTGLPQGVIAANDHVAFGIMQAAAEMSKVPGEDFLLIGFDDVPNSRIYNLSTVRPPLEQMGYEAAEMLTRVIEGKQVAQHVKLRSHLLTRASTANALRDGSTGQTQNESILSRMPG